MFFLDDLGGHRRDAVIVQVGVQQAGIAQVIGQGILPLLARAGEADAALGVVNDLQRWVGRRTGVFDATHEVAGSGGGAGACRDGLPRQQGAGRVVGHAQLARIVPFDLGRQVEVVVRDGDAARLH